MIVAIQGSKNFNDYSAFLRAMGRSLLRLEKDDKEFFIYSSGPVNINSMGLEFSNVSERGLRARGIKIRFSKVPLSWFTGNMQKINYLAYFCQPKEVPSNLVDLAESKGVDVGVYRY